MMLLYSDCKRNTTELCDSELCNCIWVNLFNRRKKTRILNVVNKIPNSKCELKNDTIMKMMCDDTDNPIECNKCEARLETIKTIELCKTLQTNFNVNIPKFRKSPKKYTNVFNAFFYNIHYDGIKSIHYSIFLIQYQLIFLNNIPQYVKFNKFITDDNKIAKNTLYVFNPNGITPFLQNTIPNFTSFNLYSFQYCNDREKKMLLYTVKKTLNYQSKYLYYAFKDRKTTNLYIYRIRVESIYIFNENTLPFKDVGCLLFYEDDVIRDLFQKENLLLLYKIEFINAYQNDSYIEYIKFNFKNRQNLFLRSIPNDIILNVNQSGIDLFDKTLLTECELNDLFNPKAEILKPLISVENISKDVIGYTQKDSIDEEDEIIDDDDDDDADADADAYGEADGDDDDDDIDDDEIIDKVEVNETSIEYVFSFNKFINFTRDEKEIIQNAIYMKLKDSEKMKLLFKPFNTVNVLKNIIKSYTSEHYFNIILYNTTTKSLSNQYHCYVSKLNEIIKITEINSLI